MLLNLSDSVDSPSSTSAFPRKSKVMGEFAPRCRVMLIWSDAGIRRWHRSGLFCGSISPCYQDAGVLNQNVMSNQMPRTKRIQ